MKKVLVVTGTRAEYGLLYWTMKEIEKSDKLSLHIVATGTHLSKDYGQTIEVIKSDGFKVDYEIEMDIESDSYASIVKSMAKELSSLADIFEELKPDVLLILGDRYEIFIAATCAMMFNVPIVHMNGGEVTEGAIDEQIRHAITKMSHVHLTGAEVYRHNVIKMGEEPWRVHNIGQAGVENIIKLPLLNGDEIRKELGINNTKKIFLVTYHPVTLEEGSLVSDMENLLTALEEFDENIVFTYPNADKGSNVIIDMIKRFCEKDNAYLFNSLGQIRYLSLMKECSVVIGNSSSGIIEAPMFKKPTVNIGTRQKGRYKCRNIIDTGTNYIDIKIGINKALFDKEFLRCLMGIDNPFGAGNVSEQVVSILEEIEVKKILNKVLF
ncbi:UDP-N-acetylglucosamine 2-epimerase [Clostridium sp.]|uniref:UDP-N-acetylglucosamine 2-epimerase n=1 Tax=Clostridium sp. TaxID=1506 RepID=UPI002FC8F958